MISMLAGHRIREYLAALEDANPTGDALKQSGQQGKKAEMLFAHLKRIVKLDTMRLRGLSGAQDEFLLAATAHNLRRMARWLMPGNGKQG